MLQINLGLFGNIHENLLQPLSQLAALFFVESFENQVLQTAKQLINRMLFLLSSFREVDTNQPVIFRIAVADHPSLTKANQAGELLACF
jgi:hypothetical protein